MKSCSILIIAICALILNPFYMAHADAIVPIRIEVGKDYDGYSNEELRRRVWQLEKAVTQLQDQVFQLAIRNNDSRSSGPWTCSIQSFGKTLVATGSTKTAATAEALKRCSDATNAVHCHESDVKCGNE